MSVREMMARLNAKTIRYDVGRGGMPELTDQDIAAAVGMCQNALARELFCLIWWPTASRAKIAETRQLLLGEVFKEFNARYVAVEMARLALHNAEGLHAAKARASDEDREEIARLKAAVRQTHAAVWPARDMSVYARIVDASITEMRTPRQCPECGGHGDVVSNSLKRICAVCAGSGNVRQFTTWRAGQIGFSESRFRASWAPIYDWVFNMIDALDQHACDIIGAALSDEAA